MLTSLLMVYLIIMKIYLTFPKHYLLLTKYLWMICLIVLFFYLVRGVEVATIKSVWKSNIGKFCVHCKFLVIQAQFWFVIGFYAKIHYNNQSPCQKTFLIKPSTFTILLIKWEKNVMEIKSSGIKYIFLNSQL